VDDAFLQKNALRDSGALMQSGQPDLGDIFDFAAQANLKPKVYEATKPLQSGQVSDPVNDSDGIHIVVMNERKVPQTPDYEAVRPRVWTDMKKQAQEKIKNATYQYLRSKADILAADVD
jgi:parvulin-like peptidyl-prolyl isomerase